MHYIKVTQPKKVTLKRTSVTVLNGDGIKPQEEEKKTDDIEESDGKDRIIKLDEVETMSQIEVNIKIFLFLINEFYYLNLFIENTNESKKIWR